MLNAILRRLKSIAAPSMPTPRMRFENRSSDFALISLRPYLTYDEYGRATVNMNRPFNFPTRFSTAEKPADGKWATKKIGCADDICMEALSLTTNMEVVAAGVKYTVMEAVLEASRREEAADCKYIVFEDPLMKRIEGKNAIVFENTAAPQGANKVMTLTLVPIQKLPQPHLWLPEGSRLIT